MNESYRQRDPFEVIIKKIQRWYGTTFDVSCTLDLCSLFFIVKCTQHETGKSFTVRIPDIWIHDDMHETIRQEILKPQTLQEPALPQSIDT